MQRRWSESEINEVLRSCFYPDYKQGRKASFPEVPKMIKNSIYTLWFEYVKKKNNNNNNKQTKTNLENMVGIGLK